MKTAMGDSHQQYKQDNDKEADPDTYDQYVGAKVVLPMGDTIMNA